MNPEELLALAQKAIANRPKDQIGPWAICYLDGKVQCVSVNCMKKPEIVFLVVSPKDVRDGLAGPQWDRLLISMSRFWSQKKL